MPVPPAIVSISRQIWHGQWLVLMNGLAPADERGSFRRRPSGFRETLLGSAQEQGMPRHVLVIGQSCPWAHRTWLVRQLKDLATVIDMAMVRPNSATGRWVFREPFEGFQQLWQLYRQSGAGPGRRATVPVLWDRHEGRIINNESADIIEQLDTLPPGPNAVAATLRPSDLIPSIQTWSAWLQDDVNDGVYRCGFARTQEAHERALGDLFAGLNAVEQALADGRPWICGESLTMVDVRLFPTMARWEAAYQDLFGCGQRPLWSFPFLWAWRRRFYQLPNVAATCPSETWRQDYFGSLFPLNPSGIVPKAPSLSSLLDLNPPIS
ncbi:glutathione S-transferase C-terminal domain-containing protein [Candidatus Synechococcus spongiarum]|uniref:Glutathione S-transferase, omega n=1 Tax=Candidatus Synechococcus spongiarum TaxID=431041 RepID=A0A164ZSA8_9SYNE|nr:glutathione S-transferase C-terminal domain-containing protein [Candidatus Synechococcus spongiarum]SAY39250.1 Glutathione S-transferase, omega (EC 2.5.1.18) [Candidatus Synechococcus spongiarum]